MENNLLNAHVKVHMQLSLQEGGFVSAALKEFVTCEFLTIIYT